MSLGHANVTRRGYDYVGPGWIRDRAAGAPAGTIVRSAADVLGWIERNGQDRDRSGCVTATFIVDEEGDLRLADRRSEHVACAGGGRVLAAGEVTFSIPPGGAGVEVEGVTNHSTGYCPEPESWAMVAAAFGVAGLRSPGGYTSELVFRRCPACRSINVVKDHAFDCAVCGSELPTGWNLAHDSPP